MKVWDWRSRQELATLKGHSVECVGAFSRMQDARQGGRDRKVKLWDGRTRRGTGDAPGHKRNPVSKVAFSPDRRRWRRELGLTGRLGCEHATGRSNARATGNCLSGQLADGKAMATGSGIDWVKLWDVRTRQVLETLNGHGGIES